jgi:lysophospholipase L1-like esterase
MNPSEPDAAAAQGGQAHHVRQPTTPRALALHVVVLVVAAAGVVALWNDLATGWRIAMAVIVAAVIGIRLVPLTKKFGRPGTIIEWVGAALGLIVIPVFVLLGVDAVLAKLGADPVSPAARLIVGAVIVLFVARVSLEPFWTWTDHELPRPWVLAVGATVLLTLVPGLVIGLIGQINGDGRTLDQRPTVSQLDVIVLRSGSVPPTPSTTRLGGWRINTWTGLVDGDRIAWVGGRRPQLSGEADADRVLILLPPATDNVVPQRWMALADRVEPRATPTYALLDRPDNQQLEAWRAPLSGPIGRTGDAVALAALPADATTPEPKLGLLAATRSPAAAAELALAVAHRPILLFDTREPVSRPLDVDALFQTGDISMCEGGQTIRERCVQLHDADELRTGFDHLAFDTHALATAKVPSRIYVHVTHTVAQADSAGSLIDLDYWWYLPDNPAHSGSGAFCGPGFSIGGVTCFDHQSDWEGVTVVLDARDPAGAPVAVNYAQHDGSVRYTWRALQRLWQLTRAQRFASTRQLDTRPLVFSARGTHASYPIACGDVSCPRNVVPDLQDTAALQDNPHDGRKPWEGNTDTACAGACVAELPTRRNGAEPEGWNAWQGEWGTANCILHLFCASADPPRSPGRQGRYQHPWCTSAAFDLHDNHFVAVPIPGCAAELVSAGDLARGRRLLAIGDSYSSGEGAGDYQPGTDTSSNTCHRSRNAWPTLLAEQRHLNTLPSIACSGATLADLLSGRPGGQPERRHSQLGRITGNPDIITVTIGGNDLGFRKVLQDCILSNCVADYHRASRDILDARIDELAHRLPAAYRAIQAAAPKARVVVVDYPTLFPDAEPNCAALNRITPAEGDYLNRKVQRADIAILDAAHQAGVTGIDVSTALHGGELSCSGTQYLNHVNLRLKLLSGSFHPNALGQERLARAVATALANLDR